MKLVTDNPNGLSVTFTEMAGIKMGDLKKVIIPKLGGGLFGKGANPIRKHVPVADVVLDQLKDIADRVELSQDENGIVSYTVCLEPGITKGQKDFRLSDQQVGEMASLITEVQAHIPISKCGSGAVHVGCLKNGFAVSETVDLSNFPQPIHDLHDVVENVLNPMAIKHGGSFEIVNIQPDQTAWSDIPDAEKRHLVEGKQNAVFDLVLFGACGGCGRFQWTYGTAPEKVTAKLKEKNADLPAQLRKVRPSKEHESGKHLIFKRPQLKMG